MKKGFTIFELLCVLIIIIVLTIFSIPIVIHIIDYSKLSSFKTSVYSVFDAVEYDIAKNKFILTEEEMKIDKNTHISLKNNNFDSGIMKKSDKGTLELVYLKQDKYCAKGTRETLKVTDKGCGHLDTTVPDTATLSMINSTNDSITLVAKATDKQSDIIKYEFSIDGKKYIANDNNPIYSFANLKDGKHEFQLKVTNEAGLTLESEKYSFATKDNVKIECINNDSRISSKKQLTCYYPIQDNYEYEYSWNDEEYKKINLIGNHYSFETKEQGIFNTRIKKDDQIISNFSIKISNLDPILNGATPELLENMIPIIYDEDKKKWIVADSKTIYWDYQNKKWANAVMVRQMPDSDNSNSKSREYYLSEAAIGTEIEEQDVLGYFVWIPRYSYQIWNVNSNDYQNKQNNGEQLINIKFQNKKQKDLGVTNDLIKNGNSYTHPAFFDEDNEYSGFWISKFPMSVKEYTECYQNPSIVNCNKSTGLELYSLPSVNPISYISISSAYLLSKNMNIENNIYGFENSEKVRLIKNTEWGAITYLTHSEYGNNIMTNNTNLIGSNNYKENVNLSTTGNVYGVYDMTAQKMEMVLGNYNTDPGENHDKQSGFIGLGGSVEWPQTNEYDLYNGITSKSRILGDATGETEGWYESLNQFVNGKTPFFKRGGNTISNNGLFNFTAYSGEPEENTTFRIAIKKY